MEIHNIPNDTYNHIQSFACGCNPTVVVSEGEESYIHKEINVNINWLLEAFNKADQTIKRNYEQNTNK